MSIPTLGQLLRAVKKEPLTFLTSRRLKSLATLLSGRDLALQHLGIPGWSDLPISERVEQHYGESTKAWRSWIDIVEFFADDEWDALDRFLELAAGWRDPDPPAPPATIEPPPLATLLQNIEQCPAMFLGAKSLVQLADFLRGYLRTIQAAWPESPAHASFVGFLENLPLRIGDSSNRPWFKVLRFRSSSQEEAFDEFFTLWQNRPGAAT